jgi:small-conductance mechanosensitive channel
MGFKLTAVLGAAGIVGVAVGFAAQTSLSNIISGLFLISERPFEVGDIVKIGDTTGVVETIDLLSVKLRTFDNRYVRIPNESLIKTEVTNVTRFPIRRFDIDIGVAYKEDIRKVMKILRNVAEKNRYCLDEPKPLILFKGFGESALEILFGVWFVKEDFLDLRNSILRDIKERFDEEGIEIPFPHQTLYAGSATEPFPVRVVGDETTSEVEAAVAPPPDNMPDGGPPAPAETETASDKDVLA